jgi:hypothetical protein
MSQKNMVADELDRRVTVPALRIGTKVLDVSPSSSLIGRDCGRKWPTTNWLFSGQRIVTVVPNQQQVAR